MNFTDVCNNQVVLLRNQHDNLVYNLKWSNMEGLLKLLGEINQELKKYLTIYPFIETSTVHWLGGI